VTKGGTGAHMDGSHIQDGVPTRSGPSRALAGALVGCAVWSAVVWTFVPMTIRVDGVEHRVASGTSALDLVRDGLIAARAGDLLTAGGAIAAPGKGVLPTILFDGEAVDPQTRVHPGVTVTSTRGADARERVVDALVAIDPPLQEVGSGPDVSLLQLGAAGLARAKVGEISHSLVATSSVIRPPVAMIVQRKAFPAGTRLVALTFDDGPWPGQTQRVLEILASQNVKATFFMMGMLVQRAPSLAKRVVAEGHLVANHTQGHRLLGRATPAQVVYEMATGEATIRRYTGVEPGWFRAPGGTVTPVVKQQAKVLGERIAGWTLDTMDWKKPPAYQIVKRVVGNVTSGSIVLMHDGGGDRKQTIDALPNMIKQLKAKGYTFVTLDQMYPLG
jgi:peptidoglycan/xylan/chitin deacetylase (PgdA/CDA1 family)